MPEFKDMKKRYIFVKGMVIVAILMIVSGLVLYMGNYSPDKSEKILWGGMLLLLLCIPVSLIYGLIYMIRSKIGGQKFITRVETCKWQKRKIDVVVEQDRELPLLHNTFVYVDNELVAKTNARQDGEKDFVEGSFVHGIRKVPFKIQQRKGIYVESEYFAPMGSSYPDPTVYFEVNINGDVIAAGNPGMTNNKIMYWSFVCALSGASLIVVLLLTDLWKQRGIFKFDLPLSLLGTALYLWKSKGRPHV
jgi:hypothetical protein